MSIAMYMHIINLAINICESFNNENNLPLTMYSYILSVASYRGDNAILQQIQLQSLSLAYAATCIHLLKNLCTRIAFISAS